MGGRSSSSSAQTSNQETTQLTSDGVIAGDLYQGKTLSIANYFPEEVQSSFEKLIDLTGSAINIAAGAGEKAIESVSIRSEQADNPELASLTKFVPVILFGIAATALVLIFRKR